MLLLSISIFITLTFCIPNVDAHRHLGCEKKRPGHYHALTDSATYSVPSHAHDQTITCDNFYLSHNNWFANFSANEFGQIFSYRRANKNCHTKIATENVLVWIRLNNFYFPWRFL